jgi:hypothetical protein
VFHIITGAAIMGVLQAVIVLILLSTTAILLAHWQSWMSQDETFPVRDWTMSTTGTNSVSALGVTPIAQVAKPKGFDVWQDDDDGRWKRDTGLSAFLQIHLAHHVAFYSLWLVCLVFYALAFRSYRASWVLPNIIMQVIGVLFMVILAGIVIAKLVLLNHEYNSIADDDEYPPARVGAVGTVPYYRWARSDISMRYAFYAILLGILVCAIVAEFFFIWIGIDFYKYLRDTHHTVHPGEPHLTQGSYRQHRNSLSPDHHMYDRQNREAIVHNIPINQIGEPGPAKIYTHENVKIRTDIP